METEKQPNLSPSPEDGDENKAKDLTPFDSGDAFTIIRAVCDRLKNEGIVSSPLKAALATMIGLNSAHLGNPLALVLDPEEGMSASGILNSCLALSPPEHAVEFGKMSPDTLYRAGCHFKGKVIVGFRSSQFKNTSGGLFLLLERSLLVSQELKREKEGSQLKAMQVEGPIAWVSIAENRKDPILNHHYVLRVPLEADTNIVRERLTHMASQKDHYDSASLTIRRASIAAQLRRLEPREVEISFLKQIIDALDLGLPHIEARFDLIMRLLKVITIINNPPPFKQEELFATYLGVTSNQVAEFMARNEESAKLLPSPITQGGTGGSASRGYDRAGPLIATKLDYYIFWILREALPIIEVSTLTKRQVRVFEAVKKVNLAWLKGLAVVTEVDNEIKVLGALHDPTGGLSYRTWASRDQIHKEIQGDGGEKFEMGTLNKELKILEKVHKLIECKRHPDVANKYIYAIKSLFIDRPSELPHPSQIQDPVYNGRALEVVNPITGEVETI